ncbi:MAG: nucleotide pyrophosphatase, partial [Planctomycetes bacterium]|nr:nucleotide pyrophosphatase [Planctomycetota bacterium]
MSSKFNNFRYLVVVFVFVVLVPSEAYAYIGPGAGFAVVGSFFVLLTAILSAVFLLLTWPVRFVIRAIRFRRVFARSRVKKVVVLGLDGLDYSLTGKFIKEGKLPNFAKLSSQGTFKPLASTVPPISPVAWSSFQTGTNPGKHNIFDFLTRDPKTYAAKLSSTDIRGPSRVLSLGKYQFPLGGGDIRLLRKAIPFWKTLGDHGIFSSVIRVPITFPAEKFYGVQLSAMCAPDLRGTQGMFSYFTTEAGSSELDDDDVDPRGELSRVSVKDNKIKAELIGPLNPRLKSEESMKCPFEISIVDSENAIAKVSGTNYQLKKGEYSEWITAEFKASLGSKISGICKFLIKSIEPDFNLYVTPININPDKPAMPISYPPVYATYLSKRQGPYATLGLIEDSWALNEKLIDDDDFMQQCLQADDEREKMFFDSLGNVAH